MRLATARKVLRDEKRVQQHPASRSIRARTIAAIHVTWKKLRPYLTDDPEQLRQARLDFINDVLKSKTEITSMRSVSDARLGRVLDAMRELERSPGLPGISSSEFRVVRPGPESLGAKPEAEVFHLATESQVAAIVKLFDYLKWSMEARESFTRKRFRRASPSMLTPKQGNSLMMILMTIAASRDIKFRWKADTGREVEHVSREMVRAEISALKRRLGIDQGPKVTGPGTDEEEANND
jgi:hypothetical protein